MISVDLVKLPSELKPEHLHNRAVVIFDVIRATTSIVSALVSGASAVRVFDSLDAVLAASDECPPPRLLCGERNCVRPEGFDLGNSPADFAAARVAGKTILMSTTNGTRAIVAASGAARRFAAALVNAGATARVLASARLDVTLLCAGTDGKPAPEDMLGAAAVARSMASLASIKPTETVNEALELLDRSSADLLGTLRATQGGRNVIAAGLEADLKFAAELDAFDLAVEITGDPPVAMPVHQNAKDRL